jgi:hypothetical protein
MELHALPLVVDNASSLLPATTYCVVPPQSAMEEAGITWHEAQVLECAFFVTKETLLSVKTYMDALNNAGYEHNAIGVDTDGKRKLVREGWEFITFGCRRLALGTSTHDMNKWVLTFVPFGVVLAPTETWQVLVYGMLALQEAVRRVWHRNMKFKAQNTDAHTSSLKAAKVMKLEASTLCYPHIVRGPADKKQRHLLVGSQEAKDAFLNDHATPDVRAMHLCQTTKQVSTCLSAFLIMDELLLSIMSIG